MPKSITLGWKEYQELLHSIEEAEDTAQALDEQLTAARDEAKRKKALTDNQIVQSGVYRKLYAEYQKLSTLAHDYQTMQQRVRHAEETADTAARQLGAANEQIKQAGRRIDALTELLKEARYVADDLARRTRPSGLLPRWLTVKEVLDNKERAAQEGIVWTVQGRTN